MKTIKGPVIILVSALILWLSFLPYFYEVFFSKLFYMPFVGTVAAIVANITPAAAGIIYFPILTHLSVAPVTVAQFNLAIQAYGMGLGTFRWFLFNRNLFLFNLLPICMLGGFLGEIVSIVVFPIKNPELLTLIFNFIAFAFTQIIFFSILRNAKYPNARLNLTLSTGTVLFGFAFIGGLMCGWIGFGIDTLFYFIMTLVFKINPAVSIVTSIALMAAMSISGTVLNAVFHDVPLALWYSAIPGVTIGGLVLSTYIAVKMGAKNILLLFTFFLSTDFFVTLWTQQTLPMSETLRKIIIYLLVFYLLAIHIKIFRSQSKRMEVSMGNFDLAEEPKIEPAPAKTK